MSHPSQPRRWLPALLVFAACWSASAQQRDLTDCDCAVAETLRRTRIVSADYPRVAKDNGLTGMVELRFTVQPDGSTTGIEVVRSEPEGVFEASAIAAVAQWRYEPVLRDGQPVAQRAMVRISFRL